MENLPIIAPLILIQFILLVVAIIDLVKIKKTNGPKVLWAFIILCISIFGPVIYFIFGRKER